MERFTRGTAVGTSPTNKKTVPFDKLRDTVLICIAIPSLILGWLGGENYFAFVPIASAAAITSSMPPFI